MNEEILAKTERLLMEAVHQPGADGHTRYVAAALEAAEKRGRVAGLREAEQVAAAYAKGLVVEAAQYTARKIGDYILARAEEAENTPESTPPTEYRFPVVPGTAYNPAGSRYCEGCEVYVGKADDPNLVGHTPLDCIKRLRDLIRDIASPPRLD